MKRILMLTVAFCLLISVASFSYDGLRFAIHTHTIASDGRDIPKKVILSLRAMGYNGVIFTDHNDNMLPPEAFANYKEIIESMGNENFIVMAGREISVVEADPKTGRPLPTLCHLNAVGLNRYPYIYDSEYSWEKVEKVLRILYLEGSFAILNHIKDCREWKNFADKFDGIELFNDFELKANLVKAFRENYIFQRDVYLDAIKNGARSAAIGGLDTHIAPQTLLGEISTFIFPECLTKECILDSLKDSRTIATSNIDTLIMDYFPSRKTNIIKGGGEFSIKGGIQTTLLHTPPKEVIVYKNGVNYKKIPLRSKGIIHSTSQVFFFEFSDKASTEENCFNFEIDGFMITSPFCFKRNNLSLQQQPQSLLSGALKIVKAHYIGSDIEINTENDALYNSYRLYEICHQKNLILTADNRVAGCYNPNFSVIRHEGKEWVIRNNGLCVPSYITLSDQEERCIQSLEESYIIPIGRNDYRLAPYPPFSGEMVLITDDTALDETTVFKVCDPKQPYTVSISGKIIDCQEKSETAGLETKEGKLLFRVLFNDFLISEIAPISGEDYFILLKK